MALLKNLSAEVSQIRESIQLSQTAVEQGLSSPGFRNYASATHPECPFPGYWPHYNPGQRGRTAQFQQEFAPHRLSTQTRSQRRRCFNCQQSDTENYCTHCYRYGSSEHLFAGCRARAVNSSRDAYLNERGLLPWDME